MNARRLSFRRLSSSKPVSLVAAILLLAGCGAGAEVSAKPEKLACYWASP